MSVLLFPYHFPYQIWNSRYILDRRTASIGNTVPFPFVSLASPNLSRIEFSTIFLLYQALTVFLNFSTAFLFDLTYQPVTHGLLL